MFQCLGLAGDSEGGCGEDWWHPECVLGLSRSWNRDKRIAGQPVAKADAPNDAPAEGNEDHEHDDEYGALPPGFPEEDDFETFICHKCVDANPWIRRYAGSTGFLPLVPKTSVLLDWADRHHAAGERTEQKIQSGAPSFRYFATVASICVNHSDVHPQVN